MQKESKANAHIPGAELTGIIDKVGNYVENLKQGDRVTVYSWVFNFNCDGCLSVNEMLCRNDGIFRVVTNGGFAEYILVLEKNIFKIPDDLELEMAARLSIAGLTPYRDLKDVSLKISEYLLVFGASGNTGTVAVQIGKRMGAKILSVSKDEWIRDFSVDHIIKNYNKVVD